MNHSFKGNLQRMRNEAGASMIEYALLLSCCCAVIIPLREAGVACRNSFFILSDQLSLLDGGSRGTQPGGGENPDPSEIYSRSTHLKHKP